MPTHKNFSTTNNLNFFKDETAEDETVDQMAKEAHLAMQKTMEDALAELCKQRDDLLHQLAEVRACKSATYFYGHLSFPLDGYP